MKNKTLETNFFNNQLQPQIKWESLSRSTFMRWVSRCLLEWRSWLGRVRKMLSSLAEAALRSHPIIRVAKELLSQPQSLSHNRRRVVGVVLWGVGMSALFAHLLFDPHSVEHQVCRVLGFDPAHCWNGKGGAESTGWCYTSWFDYVVQIRFFVALLFWSVALPLLVPHKLSIVIASSFFAVGTGWILHYSFFSTSYETINAFPHWRLFAIGLTAGFSIVMSADYLIHTYNHRVRAFEARLGTLYNGADLIDDKQFKGLFKKYVEEKKAFQKSY